MRAHLTRRLGVDEGKTPASVVDDFFEQQRNARADLFLTFIEDELHPVISERYRVRSDGVGLFGYSYGGLFSLYALGSGAETFSRFGACSPGVLTPDSKVYELYEELGARSDLADRQRHLHLTLNTYEMLGPNRFYRHLSIEFLRLLDLVEERPLPGLHLTTELISGEAHHSGILDAFRSFMRTCYSR